MNDFLTNYFENIVFNGNENNFDLTLPFCFFNGEGNVTLHLKKHDVGYYEVDDKGATLKYLSNLDVNLSDYKDRIEIICQLYSIKIENGLVKGIVGYGTNQTYKQLHNFLQAISQLSTIKFFD
jgi:hypothetical protein